MQKARVEQEIVSRGHPPSEVFIFLGAISLFTSFYIGYGMSGHPRWGRAHLLAYSVLMGGIFFLILDFEYPRLGLIHDQSPRESLKQRSIEIDLDSPQFGGDSMQPEAPAPPTEKVGNPGAN